MSTPSASHPHPSFSPARKWKIGSELALRTALVLAVAVMANYLGAQFFKRFYWSSQTGMQLSSRSLSVLRSITNRVTITLYYDTNPNDDAGEFYPMVLALAKEYTYANPNLLLRTVDYVRQPGEAARIAERYKLNATGGKNLIIFERQPDLPSDGVGPYKIVAGDALVQNGLTGISKDKQLEFGPVAFRGEEAFTAMLLALQRSHPFQAYFLQGHGEPSLNDTGNFGYARFAQAVAENYVQLHPLELTGDQPVPADCDLLIIAGPTAPLGESELQKIAQYLSQGGRLWVLFNWSSIQRPTGLESILRQPWGVNVAADYVKDPESVGGGAGVIVRRFNTQSFVNPLGALALEMILPRPIEKVEWNHPPPDAPEVQELVFSSPASTLAGDPTAAPRSYPLIVSVEQKNPPAAAGSGGETRIVVAGDSQFLDNQVIAAGANRDFVGYAVNWLLDRPQLLKGIGPRPVAEFKLTMTPSQRRAVDWLLLVALPGAVLLLGGCVWLVRRK
ncbi:MAG TPA: Gldg family protein [Verrucomicrobiae bacterium]|nr:Gldg family protein [Verrucomicrobiae bacterium]